MMRQELREVLGKLERVEMVNGKLVVSDMRLITSEERTVLKQWLLTKPVYMVRDTLAELDAVQAQESNFTR
ncbi:MAG: hypothetical protein RBR38_15405 [Desulfomicrobium apsheronum]|jgi:hypothetical protein|nr:hypothetical protein [Desulfomicrobium apsheronum]